MKIKLSNPFFHITKKDQLKDLGWVAIFFLILAVLTFPLIFLIQDNGQEFPMALQALVVIVATWICQRIRAKSIFEITGHLGKTWLKELLIGISLGGLLMLLPVIFLSMAGYMDLEPGMITAPRLISSTSLFISVAVAEEFLFRGFIFQRLINAIGKWGAQLIIAGLFLLTHINNQGMTEGTRVFAFINIFLASIFFGMAYIKTKNLAMPLGIHFMANWVQGTFLGFGVSGAGQEGFFTPVIKGDSSALMTGGNFGLEASLPGLVTLCILLILFSRFKSRTLESS